jgi:prepilin-type processing-associated H-X9-DG protein
MNDLLGGSDSTDGKDGAPKARLFNGICGEDDWGGLAGAAAAGSGFARTAADSAERAALISRYFVNRGYNTNYAASWYLVRSVPRFDFVGSDIVTGGDAVGQGLKGLNSTRGPLTMRVIDSGPVSSSLIPLLGDAAPGDLDEAILEQTIGHAPELVNDEANADPFSNGSTERRTFMVQGDLLCEAFNDGPAYWNDTGVAVSLCAAVGADLTDQVDGELAGTLPPPYGPDSAPNTYLQDTRDWYAVHGGGSQASANMLMADGSVKEFTDANNDRFLNPGFPVPDDLTDDEYAGIGYRDSQMELPPTEIFSGVFLINLQKRSEFESGFP